MIIDGKAIAKEIKTELAQQVDSLLKEGKRAPHLAAVIVGNDGASLTYVESMKKNAKEVGFLCSVYKFPENSEEQEVIDAIEFLNNDPEVDGYIIQLPLPKHISVENILPHINPDKDVDCFHPQNMGNLVLGKDCYYPATPYAVMEILRRSKLETAGKNCVVVGRSNIVGKPLALLLSQNSANANATVTLCHSKTRDLKAVCAQAELLVVAIGKPEMITVDYIKPQAVVIDVGIHRIEDNTTEKGYRLCGDVKYDEVAQLASSITPVPGGVGSVTMCCLLLNIMKAYHKNCKE